MALVHITDNFTIKRFGTDTFYSIQNYHTLEYIYLEGEDATMFETEYSFIQDSCNNELDFDKKLDILCERFV